MKLKSWKKESLSNIDEFLVLQHADYHIDAGRCIADSMK